MRVILGLSAIFLAACQQPVEPEIERLHNPDIEAIVHEWVAESTGDLNLEQIRSKLASNPAKINRRLLKPVVKSASEGGLTRERVARTILQNLAKKRTSSIQTFLHHDLNGDGIVSHEEMADTFHSKREREIEKLELKFASIDFNKDNLLSHNELTAYANHLLLQRADQIHEDIDRQTTVFIFDADKNETVSAEEVTSGLINLSSDTGGASEDRRCGMPTPSQNAEIVAVSLYDSPTLSSVAIGDENTEVHYIRIEIEPGDSPLYVTGASYKAMIWHFVGATDRIEHFAAAPGREKSKAVGVIGLGKDQLSLHSGSDCLKTFSAKKELQKIEARMAIAEALGREADHAHEISKTAKFRLPSGEQTKDAYDYERVFDEKPTNVDSLTWRSFERFNKGGIANLNADSVIANKPVRRYSILPHKGGLVQLISEDKLKMVGESQGKETYLLLKPIGRWPAGLNGSGSVNFIVPRNIPAPAGTNGHSDVYFEATGTCPRHSRLCRSITAGLFDDVLK